MTFTFTLIPSIFLVIQVIKSEDETRICTTKNETNALKIKGKSKKG